MFEDVKDKRLRFKLSQTYEAVKACDCFDHLKHDPPLTFKLAWECEKMSIDHDESSWNFCLKYLISSINNGQLDKLCKF